MSDMEKIAKIDRKFQKIQSVLKFPKMIEMVRKLIHSVLKL